MALIAYEVWKPSPRSLAIVQLAKVAANWDAVTDLLSRL